MTVTTENRCTSRHTLLDRYYTKQYNYNEYPNRGAWTSVYGAAEFQADMAHWARTERNGTLLYVNIPFCQRQCYFCTCYTQITQDGDRIERYTNTVKREIALYRRRWEAAGIDPRICALHFGGGSPTLLSRSAFLALLEQIHTVAPASDLEEVTLEVDPRGVDAEQLSFYAEQGVHRLSFGVQDFDPAVQQAIGRIQPAAMVAALLTPEVRKPFHSINFDLLCGLPRQTDASLRQTIETTCRLHPDRIMLMFLLYHPDLRPHHRLMNPAEMPELPRKLDMFESASAQLLEAGYVRIGYDHFALPEDALARAQERHDIHWNALGYRTGPDVGMIGLGAGSISDLRGRAYAQNTADLTLYQERVDAHRLPVVRGYRLKPDDRIRRAVIQRWRCRPVLDIRALENDFNICFRDTFAAELDALADCVCDGLVQINDATLCITDQGRVFQSHILGLFDAFAQPVRRIR